MKLLRILVDSRGFTLVEIIIVLALATALLQLTLFVDPTILTGHSFFAEVEYVVLVLEQARDKALHGPPGFVVGVAILDDMFVVFEGDEYAGATVLLELPRSPLVVVEPSPAIVFFYHNSQDAFVQQITFSQGGRMVDMFVNMEQAIHWYVSA